MPVGDLDGAVLGVIGFGRIGQRAAALGAALGMTVLAYDPVSQPPADVRCADLADLVRRSDVLTLHLPLLDGTRHLVNDTLLAQVKRGAILVNCGRGGLIDLDAVHAALLAGRLGGVGLDVFDPEPPAHHPLFDHPDVVLTPHVMGLSRQATAATFAAAAQGVVDVLTGGAPAAVANPDWNTEPVGMKDLLVDKVVLINGGTQGLGAAIARAAVREGATVVIGGRNPLRGQAVVDELAAAGGLAAFVRADVAGRGPGPVPGGSDRREVRPGGRCGQRRRGDLAGHPAQHHARALRAAHRGQPAGPVLHHAGSGRGHETTRRARAPSSTSSPSIPMAGKSFLAPYVAAKAGLAGLTKNAAHAHRWDRIRINGVNIGWTATDDEDALQRTRRRSATPGPMERTGRPRPAATCRWARSASPTRSPTSSCSWRPTAAAWSPVRSRLGPDRHRRHRRLTA